MRGKKVFFKAKGKCKQSVILKQGLAPKQYKKLNKRVQIAVGC